MTLQEAKEQTAKKLGFDTWGILHMDENWNRVGRIACDELAKLYADTKVNELNKSDVHRSSSFIEEILNGQAPLQHPRRSEREIIYGLRAALITSGKLLVETGLTGQLCDVADLLYTWEKEMRERGLR